MNLLNHRELSWTLFNERVLQEAQDLSVPLLQRLRFLGIFSNNQDEFLKVRVANLFRTSSPKNKKAQPVTGGHMPANRCTISYPDGYLSKTGIFTLPFCHI